MDGICVFVGAIEGAKEDVGWAVGSGVYIALSTMQQELQVAVE